VNTTVGNEVITLLEDRCYGVSPEDVIPCGKDEIVRLLDGQGCLYKIPRGSRNISNGYDSTTFEHSSESFVLVPRVWESLCFHGLSLTEQLSRAAGAAVLSPNEIAVICAYRGGVFFEGRARTSLQSSYNYHFAFALSYILLRGKDGSLHYETQSVRYTAPNLGVLLGIRLSPADR
jgi:hypothetical protein